LQRNVDQLLLNRYAPPGVVIDSDLKILEFRGRTAPYLEHSPGEANLSLLRMSRGGLAMEVRRLMQRARFKGSSARSEPIQLGVGKAPKTVRLVVLPVEGGGAADGQFVVLFEEVKKPDRQRSPVTPQSTVEPSASHRIEDLEQELRSTKLPAVGHPGTGSDDRGTQNCERGNSVQQRGTAVHQRRVADGEGRTPVHQ
jgi:two-component system CheB/CheR fusion protein